MVRVMVVNEVNTHSVGLHPPCKGVLQMWL